MGNEFGQGREWNVNVSLDWHLMKEHWHQGVNLAVQDLNKLYKKLPSLYDLDFQPQGFEWIDCQDSDQSVLSYIRRSRDGSLLLWY